MDKQDRETMPTVKVVKLILLNFVNIPCSIWYILLQCTGF